MDMARASQQASGARENTWLTGLMNKLPLVLWLKAFVIGLILTDLGLISPLILLVTGATSFVSSMFVFNNNDEVRSNPLRETYRVMFKAQTSPSDVIPQFVLIAASGLLGGSLATYIVPVILVTTPLTGPFAFLLIPVVGLGLTLALMTPLRLLISTVSKLFSCCKPQSPETTQADGKPLLSLADTSSDVTSKASAVPGASVPYPAKSSDGASAHRFVGGRDGAAVHDANADAANSYSSENATLSL